MSAETVVMVMMVVPVVVMVVPVAVMVVPVVVMVVPVVVMVVPVTVIMRVTMITPAIMMVAGMGGMGMVFADARRPGPGAEFPVPPRRSGGLVANGLI